MRNENVMEYSCALPHLRDILQNLQNYHIQAELTFVTDLGLALINALTQTFTNVSCLLCRWYISTNIFIKQRKSF